MLWLPIEPLVTVCWFDFRHLGQIALDKSRQITVKVTRKSSC